MVLYSIYITRWQKSGKMVYSQVNPQKLVVIRVVTFLKMVVFALTLEQNYHFFLRKLSGMCRLEVM